MEHYFYFAEVLSVYPVDSHARHGLFDEAPAEGSGVGEVDGELRVAVGALRRLVKERDVIARVVGELVGVAGV